jgi:hypothetical protein
MSILIEATIVDDKSGEVSNRIIKICESSYGYTIADVFDELRNKVVKIIDPNSCFGSE